MIQSNYKSKEVALMILKDEKIDKFVKEIKKTSSNLEEIMIRYSHQYVLLQGHAIPNVIQDEDYYENIRDHITFSGFSWIEPFAKMFKRMDITIDVLPDGTFDHDKVNLSVNVILPNEESARTAFIYRRFNDLSKFNQFLHSVKVKGKNGKIHTLQFDFTFEVKKITKAIREKSSGNKKMVEQWMYMIAKCGEDNRSLEVMEVVYPVVSGKIHYEVTRELVSEYIPLNFEDPTNV